jgi:hypothetical protein
MSYLGVQPGSRSIKTVTKATGDGSTTIFNVSGGYVKGFVDVFVNGIKYSEQDDYTATDNLTVVISTAPLSGDTVEIVAYSPLAIYSVVSKTGDAMTGNLTVPNLISSGNVSGTNGYFTNIKVNTNTVVNSSLYITGNTTQTGDVTLTGNLNLTGSLIITGAATSVTTQSLAVEDSIITMAANNTSDTLDIGFAGSYNNGSANLYTGFVRNATDKEFYVFDSYNTTPGNDIDLLNPSFKIANLHANFNGNLQSNSISVVLLNATNGNFTSSITLTGDASGYRQNSTTVYGGDAGTGYGRFEYYANKWVINSGSDSANIAFFQRGSSVKSWIDNNGAFTGPLVISGTVTANGGVGTANQVLTSNGTGVYWAAGGVTLAGSNTSVQFNDSGSLGGGANLTFDKVTNRLSIGNSTVNTVHTANGIIVAGDTGVVPASNTVGTTLGTSTARWVVVANTGDFTGTVTGTVANMSTSVNSALLTVGTAFIANSTAIVGTGIANVTTSVNSALLTVGTSFIANTTGAYHTGTVNAASYTVGTNFIANSTAIVGTGFANISTSVNSALLTVGTAFVANTTGAYHTGLVNASSFTVGTSFIANTIGAYHTGTINAVSFTTTNFIANTTGSYPLSNTAGTALGATTQRWVVLANTGNFSGLITGSAGANITGTANLVDVNISGNLTVSGTTTYINTTTLNIGDNIVSLNADVTNVTAPTENAGLEVNRGSAANVSFLWNETSDSWTAGNTDITGYANATVSVNSALLTVGTNFIANTTAIVGTGYANVTTSVNSALLTVGTSFIANTTGAYHTGIVNGASHTVGTAFIANSTAIVGTGFANVTTSVNSALLTVGTAFIANSTAIIGTGYANVTTSVNSALFTVGTSFIANTLGAYHTGIVNAASHTTTGFVANTTAIAPTSNTILLGNSIGRFVLSANTGSFTGTITNTLTGTTTDGGAQIYLNGATLNRIDYNTAGVAAPAFTTRSAGTKIVLFPNIAASLADFALGIESGVLWSSVPSTGDSFKWYGGTTLAASLSGAGNFNAVGSVNAASHTVGTSFIANTTGAYHTGLVNAASYTTTGFVANTTAIAPTSNTILLGNTIGRFVLSANTGDFSGTVTGVSFAGSSDERLKTNIHTINDPLSTIEKLRGVSFDRISNNSKDYGVIAQEIEQVLPDIVHTDAEGYKSVSYDSIIGFLIEGMKHQQERINQLENKLEEILKK